MTTGACGPSARAKPHAGEVATPQTLSAMIANAQAGETVLLASGDYGALNIRGKSFAEPGITIQPQPDAKVTFTTIGIDQSNGITIKQVDVDINGAKFGVIVGDSSRITLAGLRIHAPTLTSNAMRLRESKNVTVSDCDIHNVGTGINLSNSEHVEISRNTFSDIQLDAIRGVASYAEIVGNRASSFHPKPGDHPDFIQIWQTQKLGPPVKNLIKDNVYVRGNGDVAQGIFIEDNNDIVITGNALLGTMYNAISLARVNRALVENNFVQGYDDMGTRIITRGGSTDVVVRNNVAQTIINHTAGGPNPGYKEEHNRSIRGAKIGDTTALDAWLAKRDAP
jgi:parallel beta-helix repeat protein